MLPSSINTVIGTAPRQTPRAKALEVAGQFEAIFVNQMVSGMRKSAQIGGGEGLFGSGVGSDTYSQWFDNNMSTHLSSSGRIGIQEVLMREFDRLGQIQSALTTDRGNTDVIA